MWDLAKEGKFGDEYHSLYRDAQSTYGGASANMPRDPMGKPIAHSNPLTEQTMKARRRAAGIPEPTTGSKTGAALTSKALKPRGVTREVDRVRAALDASVGGRMGEIGNMRDVRATLGDMPRARQDSIMRDLMMSGEFEIQRNDNTRVLTAEDKASALDVAGDPRHYVMKSKPSRGPADRSKIGALLDSKVHAGDEPTPRTVTRARISNQTVGGRAENFLRAQGRSDVPPFEPRVARSVDESTLNTTPADLVKQLREPTDPIPAKDDTLRPLQRDEDNGGAAASSTRQEVQQHFDEATASLAPEVKARVHLVDNADALPAALRAKMAELKFDPASTPAMVYQGDTYINASMMRNRADVQDMVAHEVFGHMGTTKQLGGANYEATLSQAFDNAGGKAGFERLARQYGMWDNADGTGLKQYFEHYKTDSAHDKAAMMDELLAHAAQSRVFDRGQKATLAFVGRVKQAIADMFRKAGLDSFAAKFEKFGVADVEKFLADSKSLVEGRQPEGTIDLSKIPDARLKMLLGENRELLMPSLRGPAREGVDEQLDDARGVGRLGGVLSKMVEKVPLNDLERVFRKATGYIKTKQDMVRSYDKYVNGMFGRDQRLDDHQSGIERAIASKGGQVLRELKLLKQTDRKAHDDYAWFIHNASINRLDPLRPLSAHKWLKDLSPDQYAETAKLHGDLQKMWNRWGQPGQKGVMGRVQDLYKMHQAHVKGDRYYHAINELHDAVSLVDKGVPGFERNAVNDLADRNDLHNDPFAAYTHAKTELTARVDALNKFVMDPKNLKTVDPAQLKGIKDQLKATEAMMERIDQSPYSNLNREGDFHVKFTFKKNVDGTPNQQSVDFIRKLLTDNGFADAQFAQVNNNPSTFIKLQTLSNAAKLRDLIEPYAKDHLDSSEQISSGKLTNNDWNAADISPQLKALIDRTMEKYKGNQRAGEAAVEALRGIYFDSLPQNSGAFLGARRENVNGYSGDILKNMAVRDQVSAKSIATRAVRSERSDIAADLLKQHRDAQYGSKTADNVRKQDVIDDFLARNSAQSTRIPSGGWDKLRAYAHTFYLAASPGYMIMQLAQPYTLTLPELAKHFGYAKSMSAMASGYKDMMLVMAASAKVQHEVYGAWQKGETTNIRSGISARTLEVAQQMGLSKDTADFLQKLDNMGKLEAGTFANENFHGLDASARSSGGVKFMQMLNGTATQAELTARLVAALSSKRLHDEATANGTLSKSISNKYASREDYAGHVVSESQFEWGGNQTSRMFSKQGVLGPASPVALQFHGFATRLFSKLTTEGYNAFKGETAEERAEARRFMLAHLTAVASLGGAMGLPAAAWAAAAITKASTLMPGSGGEAYDVNSHMQHFLSGIVGKGATEVLYHGLPRALNADFSNLADKDLLPMTSFLEDRRKLEDSIPAYLSQAWGSSIGAGVNGLMGARDIMNGNVMKGLGRVLPTALKDGVKAYQISQNGYTDSAGNKLPMDAGAFAVLRQALGIQSGEMADYQEKHQAMLGAKDDRAYHSGVIKQNIAMALERGDTSGYERWIEEAQKYDADPAHAGMPISPTIGSFIAGRARARAYAASTGLPIGTSPHDLPAFRLLGY